MTELVPFNLKYFCVERHAVKPVNNLKKSHFPEISAPQWLIIEVPAENDLKHANENIPVATTRVNTTLRGLFDLKQAACLHGYLYFYPF